MSPAPRRLLPHEGAMNSLLAAVEAAAATTATAPHQFVPSAPVTSNLKPANHPHRPSNATPQYPIRAPLHSLQVQPSSSISGPHQTRSSLPPPPPLPPPLPAPPPLPPMAIRRAPTVPINSISTTSVLVTVHEASPPPAGSSEKPKGARIFSPHEKNILEANYARNKFPSRLHMQTLGRAMGKATEKVRTWYNNRRALDRKLGVDVSRNAVDQARSCSSRTSLSTIDPNEDSVILPSHAVSSPVTLAACSRASPEMHPADASEKERPRQLLEDNIFVNISPSAIAWAPSVSPVNTERNGEIKASSPTQTLASRFRMSPLRIRNGRLVLGEIEICGEISENPAADRGLEVKFLFGKKRIVYEWYCGDSYAESQSTGGPYAKMEMNFGTVTHMQLFKGIVSSVLQLSFSASPTLLLQTQESMDKYKARAQQRQYRKVGIEEFPIAVCADNHRIWMKTDDAVRVSRIIVEDTPELATVFQTWHQDQSAGTNASIPHLVIPVSKPAEVMTTTTGPADLSMPKASGNSPEAPHSKSVSTAQLSQGDATHSGIPSLEADTISPSAQSSEREARQALHGANEVPLVRPTTAAGAATNLLASPAPWHSPATPFVSSARPRREESMHWLTDGIPPSVSATPLVERTNMQESRDTGKVRRELNFNIVNQFATELTTPASQGRKRNASEVTSLENDRRRQKLRSLQSKPSTHALRFGVPDQQSPPHDQVQSREDASPMPNDKLRRSPSQAVEQSGAVLRTLPR